METLSESEKAINTKLNKMKKKPCDIKLSSMCINNCKDPSDNVCSSTGTPGLVNHLKVK